MQLMTEDQLPPAEIIAAAEKVGRWFTEKNIKSWALGSIQSRTNAGQNDGAIEKEVQAKGLTAPRVVVA